jgi:hypothetical protein
MLTGLLAAGGAHGDGRVWRSGFDSGHAEEYVGPCIHRGAGGPASRDSLDTVPVSGALRRRHAAWSVGLSPLPRFGVSVHTDVWGENRVRLND